MLEDLGRKFARFTTNQVVRRPRLWPLFRRLTRAQFNRIAPAWDEMRSDDAFAPLVTALDSLDVEPGRVLDSGPEPAAQPSCSLAVIPTPRS